MDEQISDRRNENTAQSNTHNLGDSNSASTHWIRATPRVDTLRAKRLQTSGD